MRRPDQPSLTGDAGPLLWNSLFLNPAHEDIRNMTDLPVIQFISGFDPVPFEQTASAAGSGGMLGNKNRMSPHGGLLSVVCRKIRGKPSGNEIYRMLPDRIHALFINVGKVFRGKCKPAPEFRLAESFFKQEPGPVRVFEVLHGDYL